MMIAGNLPWTDEKQNIRININIRVPALRTWNSSVDHMQNTTSCSIRVISCIKLQFANERNYKPSHSSTGDFGQNTRTLKTKCNVSCLLEKDWEVIVVKQTINNSRKKIITPDVQTVSTWAFYHLCDSKHLTFVLVSCNLHLFRYSMPCS